MSLQTKAELCFLFFSPWISVSFSLTLMFAGRNSVCVLSGADLSFQWAIGTRLAQGAQGEKEGIVIILLGLKILVKFY